MPSEFDDRAANSLLICLGLRDLEVRKLEDARFPPGLQGNGNSGVKEWGSREDYLRHLGGFNIFFAPRRHEGLGLTFLEAMAMGLCVVAEDLPTANEYLLAHQNGVLYRGDEQTLRPLAPLCKEQLTSMGKNARQTIQTIHQRWIDKRDEIGRLVKKLVNLPWEKIRPPARLLEATLQFGKDPERLWKLGSAQRTSDPIWRSQRIESMARRRRGLFGKVRWFLENPRACLRAHLEPPN